MRLLFLILFAAQFCFIPAGSAHGVHEHGHIHREHVLINGQRAIVSEIEKEVSQLGPEDIKNLVEDVHESMEGPENGETFIEKTIEKLNFKTFLRNTYRNFDYRWDDPKTQGHVRNLLMLFALSHPTEIAVAPVLAAYEQYLLSALSMIIWVPGLDPVCIGLVISYKTLPPFRGLVTVARVTTLKLSTTALKYTGVAALSRFMADRYIKTVRPAERLSNWLQGNKDPKVTTMLLNRGKGLWEVNYADQKGALLRVHLREEDPRNRIPLEYDSRFSHNILHIFDEPKPLTARQQDSARLFLESVTFPINAVQSVKATAKPYNQLHIQDDAKARTLDLLARLTKPLKLLGWNIRDAVMEAAGELQKNNGDELLERFYVEKTSRSVDDNFFTVNFKPKSISIRPSYKIQRSCGVSLSEGA